MSGARIHRRHHSKWRDTPGWKTGVRLADFWNARVLWGVGLCLVSVVGLLGKTIAAEATSASTSRGSSFFLVSAPDEQVGNSAPVVTAMDMSPDAQLLAVAGDDWMVRLYDAGTGKLLASMAGHHGWIYALAFCENGSMLVSGGRDGQLRIWDTDNRTLVRAVAIGTCIRSIAVVPPGDRVLVGGFDGTLWLVSIGKGQVLARVPIQWPDAASAAVDPNSNMAAVGFRGGTVALLKLPELALLSAWKAHNKRVNALRFSPDSKLLVSAGDDSTVKAWNINPPALVAKFKSEGKPVSLVFCTDQLVAVGCCDNVVRVWNLQNSTLVTHLSGHMGTVSALVWDKENQRLISGGFDTTVRSWFLDPQRLAAR